MSSAPCCGYFAASLGPISVAVFCLPELIVSGFSYPQMFILLIYLEPVFLQEEFKAAYKNANTTVR